MTPLRRELLALCYGKHAKRDHVFDLLTEFKPSDIWAEFDRLKGRSITKSNGAVVWTIKAKALRRRAWKRGDI